MRSIEYRGSACLEVGSALRADLVAPFSVPDLHDCLKVGRSLPWSPFAKARATTGQSLRPYQPPTAHGRDSDHVPTSRQSLKGKPEDWPGAFLSGLRSRPSGAWFGYSGSASGGRKSVLCPLSSIQPSSIFGWQVAAPGGGWRALSIQPSTQSSTQPSIQPSVVKS
jgi:hypothetical protein